MSSTTVNKKDTIVPMSVEDPAYKKTPSTLKQVLYWAYAVIMAILLGIFMTANMQLTYGNLNSGKCVLFWTTSHSSPYCSANFNAGIAAFVLVLILTTVRVMYVRSCTSPGKVITLCLAIVYTFLAFCALAFAIIYSAGVRATCNSLVSNEDCAARVFDRTDIFWEQNGYKMDSNLILKAAVASIWLVFGSFTSFSIYEWIKFRKFN